MADNRELVAHVRFHRTGTLLLSPFRRWLLRWLFGIEVIPYAADSSARSPLEGPP